jgi:hypothetical protein
MKASQSIGGDGGRVGGSDDVAVGCATLAGFAIDGVTGGTWVGGGATTGGVGVTVCGAAATSFCGEGTATVGSGVVRTAAGAEAIDEAGATAPD